tara:strand:- start:722 stop:931 length:210 start_codon:yes stop_codon:yes gene_type:complete
MRVDAHSLNTIDLEELSRRSLIDLSSTLIEALEEARKDLSESVRVEIEQKFEIAELRKKLSSVKGDDNV